MKKIIIALIFMTFLIILGCQSKDDVDPNDTMESFINYWEKGEYSKMSTFLSEESIGDYGDKSFAERAEDIYTQIGLKNLDITFSELDDDAIKTANKDEKVQIPFEVQFDTLAGEIEFSNKMTLNLVESENEDVSYEWVIDWEEDYLLPHFEENSQVKIVHEEARRGEILDRNKMPLALNDTAYQVGIVPGDFEDESSELEQIASLLSTSTDSIKNKLDADWVQEDFLVPITVIASSKEDLYNQLKEIPAVSINETTGRIYPLGPAAAHITGYIGPVTAEDLEENPKAGYTENDFIGKIGLEKKFEEQLKGEQGVEIIVSTETETESIEEETIAEKPVKNGEKIQLNIDVNVQEKIFNAFEDDVGTAVAIDPKSGEVLALVSHPAYDPNDFTYGISQSEWDNLINNKSQPLLNRFASTFAPGSVIKPITAAIGLENGTIDPEESFEINGKTWHKDSFGPNNYVTRYSIIDNPVNLEDAIVHSDNIYFAMQAINMGSDKFMSGLKDFGFEDDIPLKISIEPSQISNDGELNDEFSLANTSYGQGQMETSPVHLAYAFTAFLNEGNIVKPSFMFDDKKDAIWKENVISKDYAKLVKSDLEKVVSEGSAQNAKTKKLKISGKTGTAELRSGKDEDGQENGWFIAYPTEDEDIMIAMMIESVEDRGISGYVAEKVKDVMVKIKKSK